MGKRGPSAAPTQLKVVRGDRPSRVNLDEPQPMEGLPACPEGATRAVRDVWDYTIAQLAAMRVVTAADRDSLYVFCEAVVLHREAADIVAQEGVLIEGRLHGGLVKNPACQIMRDAAAVIKAFAGEFGLTPSARAGIKMSALEGPKEQGPARLLSS